MQACAANKGITRLPATTIKGETLVQALSALAPLNRTFFVPQLILQQFPVSTRETPLRLATPIVLTASFRYTASSESPGSQDSDDERLLAKRTPYVNLRLSNSPSIAGLQPLILQSGLCDETVNAVSTATWITLPRTRFQRSTRLGEPINVHRSSTTSKNKNTKTKYKDDSLMPTETKRRDGLSAGLLARVFF